MKLRRYTFVVAFLLAGLATGSHAGVRTATVGVSAIVMTSCRVDVASQLASAATARKLTHRGQCSGDTRPATLATVETQPMLIPAEMVRRAGGSIPGSSGEPTRAWIRYDVEY